MIKLPKIIKYGSSKKQVRYGTDRNDICLFCNKYFVEDIVCVIFGVNDACSFEITD